MRARDTVEGAGESLAEFVAALRQLRQLAGRPTYEQMSEGGPYSGSALCRAQAGRRVPTWGVTSAFVRACGGDGDWWFEQYQKLIDALQTGQRVEFTPQNPHGFPGLHVPLWALAPRQIRGITEFSWYMKMIWRQSGLTFTEIAARTAEPGIAAAIDKPGGIAISTLSDLCNPKCTRIPTWRTLCGFLMAVGVSLDAVWQWERLLIELATGREKAAQGKPSLPVDVDESAVMSA